MANELPPAPEASPPASFATPLHPDAYVWFVLASALDVFLTFVVLQLGGREVNKIAAWVIEHLGFAGMALYKFAIVVFVILLCQTIGVRNPRAGRKLAEWAVALTFVPVVFSLVLLGTHQL